MTFGLGSIVRRLNDGVPGVSGAFMAVFPRAGVDGITGSFSLAGTALLLAAY